MGWQALGGQAWRPTLRSLNFHGVNANFLDGPVLGATGYFGDLLNHGVTLDHFAENAVLIIQMAGGRNGDEELAAVGVGAGVGHGKYSRFGVLQRGVELVGELVARTAAPGAFRVAALDHEVRKYAVKNRAVIKRLTGLGPFRETHEVLHGFGRLIGMKFDFELALGGIECGVDFVCHHSDCISLRAPELKSPAHNPMVNLRRTG